MSILVFFAQIWTKINFPGKKAMSVFKYYNYLPLWQKFKKKLICHYSGKCWSDRWIDTQTEGQTDKHDFEGKSVERGSNY